MDTTGSANAAPEGGPDILTERNALQRALETTLDALLQLEWERDNARARSAGLSEVEKALRAQVASLQRELTEVEHLATAATATCAKDQQALKEAGDLTDELRSRLRNLGSEMDDLRDSWMAAMTERNDATRRSEELATRVRELIAAAEVIGRQRGELEGSIRRLRHHADAMAFSSTVQELRDAVQHYRDELGGDGAGAPGGPG
ncbi:MAG: hypothetical protein AB2A00_34635 [Myxococcota bacterium]